MTLSTTANLIIAPALFTSKKALAEALNRAQDPTTLDQFHLEDPPVHGRNFSGCVPNERLYPVGFSAVVTNHPKRTKFAKITRTAAGWKVE